MNRQWAVVRVTPVRPEAIRERVGLFDSNAEAWAEHDRWQYHEPKEPGVYYEVIMLNYTEA